MTFSSISVIIIALPNAPADKPGIRDLQRRTGTCAACRAEKEEGHPMLDLLEIRDEIDVIDKEIVRLYEHRMDLATQVAEFKIRNGKEVFDAKRELDKLQTLSGLASTEFTTHGVHELFEHIMSMSRKRQYQLLTEYGKIFDTGFDVCEEEEVKRGHVYVTRQDRYALEHFIGREATPVIMDTSEEMFAALKNEEDSYGFLEVGVDSPDKSVISFYNLICEHDCYIVREFKENAGEKERCLLITNKRECIREANKVSLCFEAPDESGMLYHLLSHITYNSLNLNRIGSFVICTDPLDYRFFIDVDGSLTDASIQNAIRGLSAESRNFKILGNYL